jgi:predicted ABC-type ATPase
VNSFETVFSHKGKVEFVKRAKAAGYKVYLYFVSTESPEINVYRVKEVRVKEGGHDVPEDKIVSRYDRSMEFLYEAAQYCYQVYFFDNSKQGQRHTLFAQFKMNAQGEKDWKYEEELFPEWFYKYYNSKSM